MTIKTKIMKFIIKLRMPIDRANEATSDPQFGHKMNELLNDLKVEAAYFTLINGQRGGFLVVNMNDASEMPKYLEPFFAWLNVDAEAYPVMTPADLQKAGPYIASAFQKWSP
jgi:hypothetical protein